MPLKKTITIFLLLLATFLVSGGLVAQDFRSGTIPAIPYGHKVIAPPGMVYVEGGVTLINYDQSTIDTNSIKKVSLTSFFMDKTETTNFEYKNFINWVVDSIAIVKYIKDPKYFLDYKEKETTSSTTENTSSSTDNSTASQNNSTAPMPDSASRANDSARIAGGTRSTDTTKPAGSPSVDNGSNNTPAVIDTTNYSKKRIDWSKVDHDAIFNSKNEDIKAKIAPMLDENGNIKKEMYTYSYKHTKVISTTNHNGKNKVVIETINVYPDENVWAQDLTNASTEMYVENYFKAAAFNDYPVVGVTWPQANAYCYWRGNTATNYYNMPEYMKSFKATFSLPSEAQWVYAAQGFYELIYPEDTPAVDTSTYQSSDSISTVVYQSDSTQTPHDSTWVALQVQKKIYDDSIKAAIRDQKMAERQKTSVHKSSKAMNPNLYVMDYIKMLYFFNHRYNGAMDTTKAIDSTMIHKDPNGMLMNFKQQEGDYWEDGAALTTPVMSFAPNEFGLYNMEGNVAEWTMDAYSPSAYSFVSDINPVLQYDADSTDAPVMKRKVVRGGSFMGNAKSLSPFYRDMEIMDVSHCYIGFRCVMAAPETIHKNTSTRNKTQRGKKTPGKFSGVRLPEIH